MTTSAGNLLQIVTLVAVTHVFAMASPGPTALLIFRTAADERQLARLTALGVALATLVIGTATSWAGAYLMGDGMRRVISLAGAGYFVLLAFKLSRDPQPREMPEQAHARLEGNPGQKAIGATLVGFLVNFLNPKAWLLIGTLVVPVSAGGSAVRWLLPIQLFVQALVYWQALTIIANRPRVRGAMVSHYRLINLASGCVLLLFAVWLVRAGLQ